MSDINHWTHSKDGEYIQIPPMETLCKVLKTKFENQENLIDHLRQQIKALESEKWKDEKLQEMRKTYEKMQKDYRRGFPISEAEKDKINEWIDNHEKEKHMRPNGSKYYFRGGAIGGSYTYCFTPTSIGTFGSIKCTCGEEFTFQEEA